MDVIIAFLNPVLQKEVYIELPKGASLNGGKLYCRLKKCLYRLKQSPCAWYKDINAFLTGTLSLTRSKEDPNLYIS
jgi:hypothetical protein